MNILLPSNFQPTNGDVICGRGSRVFMHDGNKRFREVVASRFEEYAKTGSRIEKSDIICQVVEHVRSNSPSGTGFVKKCGKTGQWFQVGDFLAREKTSQAFRDLFVSSYKSSNALKRRNRRLEQRNSGKAPNASARRWQSVSPTLPSSEVKTTPESAVSAPTAAKTNVPVSDGVSKLEFAGTPIRGVPSAQSVLDDPFRLTQVEAVTADTVGSLGVMQGAGLLSVQNEMWGSFQQQPQPLQLVAPQQQDLFGVAPLQVAPEENVFDRLVMLCGDVSSAPAAAQTTTASAEGLEPIPLPYAAV